MTAVSPFSLQFPCHPFPPRTRACACNQLCFATGTAAIMHLKASLFVQQNCSMDVGKIGRLRYIHRPETRSFRQQSPRPRLAEVSPCLVTFSLPPMHMRKCPPILGGFVLMVYLPLPRLISVGAALFSGACHDGREFPRKENVFVDCSVS